MLARLTTAISLTVACSSCSRAGSLEAAAENLGVADLSSIQYDGSGANFSVGQPYVAGEEWPRVNIVTYRAAIDYEAGTMRVDLVREQPVSEPMGGGVRFPGQQTQIQMVSGGSAWNMYPVAADGSPPPPQPAAATERMLQIWTTPHGFIKAATSREPTILRTEEGNEVTFTLESGHRVAGTINANNEVERVRTWIDNPVLGDMLVETTYSDYQELDGVRFPTRIQQTQGGHPSLDLTITEVQANSPVAIFVPPEVTAFQPAAVQTTVDRMAEGVYYIRGGSHHSVAIEMADHVVVVEGPQSEARGAAVIDAVQATIPNKPIRFVVNTHVHFDHSGGLRPFVDAGATVVTHESNRAFYERAWAAPRTLNPDRLAGSAQQPSFQTVGDKGELTDGRRRIELYTIPDNPHTVGFLMAWLPTERILIEVDAYTPGPAGAAPAAPPSANTVALYEAVRALGLNVRQILPLHGARAATLADLRAAAGR